MKNIWYAGGLHFECIGCGACCSGPSHGYIWVTRPEIQLIADFLKIEPEQLRQRYLRRVGLRTTIIEHPNTKDCVFLQMIEGQKRCTIYPVRPSQCRTWPFWPDNLASPDAWNKAAQRCPGINRGRLYSFEEIEKIRKGKNNTQTAESNLLLKKVAGVYDWLEKQIQANSNLLGECSRCGKCCDFGSFDHRLFVTTPELMYLAEHLGPERQKPMTTSKCPYNIDGECTIYQSRFAGCRIFQCRGNADFQNRLSESAVKKFKSICEQFQIPYRYSDLATALNTLAANIYQPAGRYHPEGL